MADRAVIAIRVSPRPAENVRYSPEIQERQCRDWCEANGHEVVGVVSDILVSGGSARRFDSIHKAIDEWRPDLFVVADLSRWTRDTPTRYFAMKAILEDSGIRLSSVSESFVGSDLPFSDTITTAVVEANLQQRLVNNRKTSEGIRRAWASGKWFGRAFGWTWDPKGREWSHDDDAIRSLYEDWVAGVSIHEMARRYGMRPQNIRPAIAAKRQRDVVGDEAWQRAQMVERARSVRFDAKWGNVWRGLLRCPFCQGTLVQETQVWGRYRCGAGWDRRHPWQSVSARVTVLPEALRVLSSIVPDEEAYASRAKAPPRRRVTDPQAERDRWTDAWAKQRISTERYEAAIAEIESRAVLPQPEPSREVASRIHEWIAFLDCRTPCRHERGRCPRDIGGGSDLNDLLRELLEPIAIHEDRKGADVRVRERYRVWVSD